MCQCKDCENAKSLEQYYRNPEKMSKRASVYWFANKERLGPAHKLLMKAQRDALSDQYVSQTLRRDFGISAKLLKDLGGFPESLVMLQRLKTAGSRKEKESTKNA
jgi:hypothetical protein